MKKFLLLFVVVLGLVWALSQFKGHSTAIEGEFDSIVMDFREGVPAEQILGQVDAIAQQFNVTPQLNSEFSQADNLYILKGDRQLLEQLRKSPFAKNTEYIEPNYIYQLPQSPDLPGSSATSWPDSQGLTDKWPNDPDYPKQWNLRDINIEAAWKRTRGKGVTVAVIDTGVSRVVDLQQTQMVRGYDFVNDKEDAADDHGHGTHVAGTIAQTTNNGYGVAGIAHEASIMPLKVLSARGSGTVSDIAEAIRFAADNRADVINMSLGGGGDSQVMREAIDYANKKGVVVIAAAGNANYNSASYPALYPRVVGVSALDSAEQKAFYSNYGKGVDISAPGGGREHGILQDTVNLRSNGSTLMEFRGTSMASPHVAGVAALVKAAGVKNPNAVVSILQKSARKVDDDHLNHYGAGRLDAAEAVRLASLGRLPFPGLGNWGWNWNCLGVDFGAIAVLPKLTMLAFAILLSWFLRRFLPKWNWLFVAGLVLGSSGLFFLRGVTLAGFPQWPLQLLSSSIPELGTAIQGTAALNPIFASVVSPIVLFAFLWGNSRWRWFAIGSSLGIAACLAVSAAIAPSVVWLGSGTLARGFLFANALLCFYLARLTLKP